MPADLLTAVLLLNPMLTFEEAEREVAMMRTAVKKRPPEGDQRVTSRDRADSSGTSSRPAGLPRSRPGTPGRG